TDVAATVCVRNPRRWIPSLSVSAVPIEKQKERLRWRWVATTFPVPPWRPPERQWLQLPDRKLRRVTVGEPSGVFHETAYFRSEPTLRQRFACVILADGFLLSRSRRFLLRNRKSAFAGAGSRPPSRFRPGVLRSGNGYNYPIASCAGSRLENPQACSTRPRISDRNRRCGNGLRA